MSLEIDCRLLRGKFSLDVQLSVERGSTLAITGENGSGKTSTLDMVAGLLACTKGKILLHGKALDDSTSGRFVQPELRGVSTVFQGGGLFSHLSVEKNILFGRNAAYKNTTKLDNTIGQFNLAGLMSRKPPTLSGGQRQRVALARAFLAPSDILLLDEPTTSLDAVSRDEVRRAMKAFRNLRWRRDSGLARRHRGRRTRHAGGESQSFSRRNYVGETRRASRKVEP